MGKKIKKTDRNSFQERRRAKRRMQERLGAKDVLPSKQTLREQGYDQKASDALLAFAKPLLDEMQPITANAVQNTISIAASYWNAFLTQQGPDELWPIARDAGMDLETFERLWQNFAMRKINHFSHDERIFTDIRVVPNQAGDDFQLHVSATLLPEDEDSLHEQDSQQEEE